MAWYSFGRIKSLSRNRTVRVRVCEWLCVRGILFFSLHFSVFLICHDHFIHKKIWCVRHNAYRCNCNVELYFVGAMGKKVFSPIAECMCVQCACGLWLYFKEIFTFTGFVCTQSAIQPAPSAAPFISTTNSFCLRWKSFFFLLFVSFAMIYGSTACCVGSYSTKPKT